MSLTFTKMHGLGNDFMVVDATVRPWNLNAAQIQRLADRHTGIGFDQLLLVESSDQAEADFRYRIFNADGGEVEQCGNGARCFASYVRRKGMTDKSEITVNTAAGLLELRVQPDGQVQVGMGQPRFAPADIPFNTDSQQGRYELAIAGKSLQIGAVSMGNPHAVLQVEDVEQADVAGLGPLIEAHSDFPNRVNAGFMQVIDEQHIRLRVYERGAGETLACGSGACAAVVIGQSWGLLAEQVTVTLPGGELVIQWSGGDNQVYMTGPVAWVYDGTVDTDLINSERGQ